MSDTIFLSISIIWFTQLFEIENNHKNRFLICHIVVLILAILVRYQSFIYPIISLTVMWNICNFTIKKKIVFTILFFCSVFIFIQFIVNQNKKTFGVSQFSISTGWQLANNALLAGIDRQLSDEDSITMPNNLIPLHYYVVNHNKIRTNIGDLSGVYIWNYAESPLAKFSLANNRFNRKGYTYYKWIGLGMANVDNLYREYATFIIDRHRWIFIKCFLLRNIVQYFIPSIECLNSDYMGSGILLSPAVDWFHYSGNRSYKIGNFTETDIVVLYLMLFMFFQVIYLVYTLIVFFKLRNLSKRYRILVFVTLYYLIMNFIFSVSASPVVFRYQIFNSLILFMICTMSIELTYSVNGKISKASKGINR